MLFCAKTCSARTAPFSSCYSGDTATCISDNEARGKEISMDGFLLAVSEMFIPPAHGRGSAEELLNPGTRGSLPTRGNTKQPMGNEAEQGQENPMSVPQGPSPRTPRQEGRDPDRGNLCYLK